jgi:hypothetical protein
MLKSRGNFLKIEFIIPLSCLDRSKTENNVVVTHSNLRLLLAPIHKSGSDLYDVQLPFAARNRSCLVFLQIHL